MIVSLCLITAVIYLTAQVEIFTRIRRLETPNFSENQEVASDESVDFSNLAETGSLADFEDEFADERDDDENEDGETENELDEDTSVSFDE